MNANKKNLVLRWPCLFLYHKLQKTVIYFEGGEEFIFLLQMALHVVHFDGTITSETAANPVIHGSY
jgi:hypothetical protein